MATKPSSTSPDDRVQATKQSFTKLHLAVQELFERTIDLSQQPESSRSNLQEQLKLRAQQVCTGALTTEQN